MTLGRSIIIASIALLSATAQGAERSFDGITCKSYIPSALIGRHMPNERVVTIEARYKEIGLKDLGAYGMEAAGDPWTLISWQICGREYLLLERRGIVQDVLASPLPQESAQFTIASCVVDGSSLHGTAVIFVSAKERQLPKPVEHAWLINDKTIRFSKIKGKEIVCTP